ncbi:unnamed protein product [Kuraishia capsulata CBS 1993]|uniref:Kinesin-like protein KIP1 n=1 Tax=Kuraishia capsulata CBS 1993 TaxID=1382522 RepID=W6MIZ1_9ASCO|nr:uncharacterized protein KUCA_T00001889001 [Kuraishia capsulata CBS 1993]CDK25918.1 unnamed protein product [Kuraishia capsulata CBS 1993]
MEKRLAQRSVSVPSRQPPNLNKRVQPKQVEETNISVYVRCRTRNDREIKENSGVVVSTTGNRGKEVILQTGPMNNINKTYTFDRVFGAESDQETVYEGIAAGVLDEVLRGYNCTVFAYGQTGTGKTYTMSGDIDTNSGSLGDNAGIIPRTLIDLFKNLQSVAEYSVRISFIELYNEELRDLLSPTYDDEERKVKIFDGSTKKSIKVQGMEEIFIKSPEEGLKLLRDGSIKRQVASTKCNDLSSRSHTVFSITVHMKLPDVLSGEAFMKVGKLNLVDLAGSENISRSGAENKRAREAGMINQSLLTLGRVINALVENSPHIPYRESKLTRLLQDSLGGQTKTCIIATISPAKVSLDETLSTLEYAYRAKSIKNKPQVNQSMNKSLLIGEYIEEIERLRRDLNATRMKNGVYLTDEDHKLLLDQSESRRILARDLEGKTMMLDERVKNLKLKNDELLESTKKSEMTLREKEMELSQISNDLQSNQVTISDLQMRLEKKDLAFEMLQKTERELQGKCQVYASGLGESVEMIQALSSVISKKFLLEQGNLDMIAATKKNLSAQLDHSCEKICSQIQSELDDFSSKTSAFIGKSVNNQTSSISLALADLRRMIQDSLMKDDASRIHEALREAEKTASSSASALVKYGEEYEKSASDALSTLSTEIHETKRKFQTELAKLSTNHASWFSSFDKLFNSLLTVVEEQMGEQVHAVSLFQKALLLHKQQHERELEKYKNEILSLQKEANDDEKRALLDLKSQIHDLFQEHDSRRDSREQIKANECSALVDSLVAMHGTEMDQHHGTLDGLKESTSQFSASVKGERSRIHDKVHSMSEVAAKSAEQFSKTVNDGLGNVDTSKESIRAIVSDVGQRVVKSANDILSDVQKMHRSATDVLANVSQHNEKLVKVCDTHQTHFTESLQNLVQEASSFNEQESTATVHRLIAGSQKAKAGMNMAISKTCIKKDDQKIPSIPEYNISLDIPSKHAGEGLHEHSMKKRRVADEKENDQTTKVLAPSAQFGRGQVLKPANR